MAAIHTARTIYNYEKHVKVRFQMGKDTFSGLSCPMCNWPLVVRTGISFTYDVCRNDACRHGSIRKDDMEQNAVTPIFYWQFRKWIGEKKPWKEWRAEKKRQKREQDA